MSVRSLDRIRWGTIACTAALSFALTLPAGRAAAATATTLRGTLVVVHQDAGGTGDGLMYFLEKADGKLSPELRFAQAPKLPPGAALEVTGTSAGGVVQVGSVSSTAARTAAAVPPTTTGTKRLLVILVEWSGSNTLTTDQATADDYVFGTTDAQRRSVRQWYQDVSYGQIDWIGSVTPVLTIADSSDCSLNTIANRAETAAVAAGYTLANFDNRMIDVPSDCGSRAYGQIAGPRSWIADGLWDIDDGYARMAPDHELGHNLGEYHGHLLDCGADVLTNACITSAQSTDCEFDTSPCMSEYGNAFDVMGINWTSNPYDAVNWFGIWHEMAFGWVNGRTTTDAQPATAQDHQFTIAPIEQSTGMVGLTLDTANNRRFVVEFRQPLSQDAYLTNYPDATSGVLISMRDPGTGYDPGPLNIDGSPDSTTAPFCSSFTDYCDGFDAAFNVGQTFADPDGNFTLTVDATNAAGATVTVHWAGGGGGGGTTFQETAASVAYHGWQGVADAGASGGTYRLSSTTGDKLTWKSAATTSLTWVMRKGPNRGNASITIDGVAKPKVDLYAASPQSSSITYSGLTNAAHTVVIKVLGTKNAASTGTGVVLDAFTVGGGATTQDDNVKVTYGVIKGATSASASGGTYRFATAATARFTFSFTGTGVDWITTKGTAYGKAEVLIDGVNKGPVDLYRSATLWKAPIAYSGLAAGPHTMVVHVLAQKNASATSTKVVVDGFVVHI